MTLHTHYTHIPSTSANMSTQKRQKKRQKKLIQTYYIHIPSTSANMSTKKGPPHFRICANEKCRSLRAEFVHPISTAVSAPIGSANCRICKKKKNMQEFEA